MNEFTSPVKLNALKHHFSYLQHRIDQWAGSEWDMIREELQELGGNQFDVYTGNLPPEDICIEINNYLTINQVHSRSDLHQWLGRQGYKTVTISDNSRWVIRESESGTGYAHIHPARNQSGVKRIKANHLKTAVALICENRGNGEQVLEFTTIQINAVRIARLGLSPIKAIRDSGKILNTMQFLVEGPGSL
jgi:hypothetical protein